MPAPAHAPMRSAPKSRGGTGGDGSDASATARAAWEAKHADSLGNDDGGGDGSVTPVKVPPPSSLLSGKHLLTALPVPAARARPPLQDSTSRGGAERTPAGTTARESPRAAAVCGSRRLSLSAAVPQSSSSHAPALRAATPPVGGGARVLLSPQPSHGGAEVEGGGAWSTSGDGLHAPGRPAAAATPPRPSSPGTPRSDSMSGDDDSTLPGATAEAATMHSWGLPEEAEEKRRNRDDGVAGSGLPPRGAAAALLPVPPQRPALASRSRGDSRGSDGSSELQSQGRQADSPAAAGGAAAVASAASDPRLAAHTGGSRAHAHAPLPPRKPLPSSGRRGSVDDTVTGDSVISGSESDDGSGSDAGSDGTAHPLLAANERLQQTREALAALRSDLLRGDVLGDEDGLLPPYRLSDAWAAGAGDGAPPPPPTAALDDAALLLSLVDGGMLLRREHEAQARLAAEAAAGDAEAAARRAVDAAQAAAERNALAAAAQEAAAAARVRELEAERRAALRAEALQAQFSAAEARLARSLGRQKALASQRYGLLQAVSPSDALGTDAVIPPEGATAIGATSGVTALARDVRVTWDGLPQPVRLHVVCLRGVKDRLPSGQYVVSACLWDRLGGRVLRYAADVPRRRHGDSSGGSGDDSDGPTTAPVRHGGRFWDVELPVDAGVTVTLPPPAALRPGMVFLLRLVRLACRRHPLDAVLGWTVLPACDGDRVPAVGDFRLPLLRGDVDPTLTSFVQFERSVGGAHRAGWLCNAYVSVALLPRRLALERRTAGTSDDAGLLCEYDARLAASAAQLRLRRRPGGGSGDGEDAGGASVAAVADRSSGWLSSRPALTAAASAGDGYDEMTPLRHTPWRGGEEEEEADGDDGAVGAVAAATSLLPPGVELPSQAWHAAAATLTGSPRRAATRPSALSPAARRRYTYALPKQEPPLDPTGDDDANHDDAPARQRGTAPPVARLRPLPSLARAFAGAGRKVRFVFTELLADLAPPGPTAVARAAAAITSLRFWAQLALAVAALWLRAVAHTLGQYALLAGLRVPTYALALSPVGAGFKWVPAALPPEVDIGVVAAGPAAATAAFAVCAGGLAVLQSLLGDDALAGVGAPLCWFALWFGLWAAADGPLVAAVDTLAAGRPDCTVRYPPCGRDPASPACPCFEGDAWRLPRRFALLEGSPVMGAAVVAACYLLAAACTLALWWRYAVDVHCGGRVGDAYTRLHAPEAALAAVVPSDDEVAWGELHAAVARAGAWVGPGDRRRRVVMVEQTTSTHGGKRGGALHKRTHVVIVTCGPPVVVDGDGGSDDGSAASAQPPAPPSALNLLPGPPLAVHRHFVVMGADGAGATIHELLPSAAGCDSGCGDGALPADAAAAATDPWWGAAAAVAHALRAPTHGGVGCTDTVAVAADGGAALAVLTAR